MPSTAQACTWGEAISHSKLDCFIQSQCNFTIIWLVNYFWYDVCIPCRRWCDITFVSVISIFAQSSMIDSSNSVICWSTRLACVVQSLHIIDKNWTFISIININEYCIPRYNVKGLHSRKCWKLKELGRNKYFFCISNSAQIDSICVYMYLHYQCFFAFDVSTNCSDGHFLMTALQL